MKKSLIYIFPAIMCLVGTHADAVTGWGDNESVANAWGTVALGYTMSEYKYADEDSNLCIANADPDNGCTEDEANELYECGKSANGCKYNVKITYTDYQLKLATDTLFRQVLGTLEREAQAQYNAKLTEEQNMCRNANSGGVMGRKDMTSTYRWVKLKKNKVPKSYATAGLTDKDIDKSNDLYGSFCAARVTLQSDDADIQEEIRKGADWSSVYFAVGDVFTCGSWIPQSELQAIAKKIAERKYGTKDNAKDLSLEQMWWTGGATLLGTGLFAGGADLLQTKTGLGGLLGTKETQKLSKTDGAILAANLSDATHVFQTTCGNSRSTVVDVWETTTGRTMLGQTLKEFSTTGSGSANSSCSKLKSYIDTVNAIAVDGGTESGNDKTRRWVDVGAGAVGGIATLVLTRASMREANANQWDKDTQAAVDEFMANVGSHITCWIGAEESGTFGDVVEIGME